MMEDDEYADITVIDNENQIYNVIEKKKQKDIQKMRYLLSVNLNYI